MSRAQVENDRYKFAFGVDHTPMGCFFQIWEKAAEGEVPEMDETDTPQVEADEMCGWRISNVKTLERNPVLAKALAPFGNLRNEETVIAIGKAMGFDVSKEVFMLWD